jgi:hypothetical protein
MYIVRLNDIKGATVASALERLDGHLELCVVDGVLGVNVVSGDYGQLWFEVPLKDIPVVNSGKS